MMTDDERWHMGRVSVLAGLTSWIKKQGWPKSERQDALLAEIKRRLDRELDAACEAPEETQS